MAHRLRSVLPHPTTFGSLAALLLLATMPPGCTNQGKANVNNLSSSPACANTTPATLDDIWTQYLSGTPASTRGGCAVSGCHLDGAGGMQFGSPSEFAAVTINVPSASDPSHMRIQPGDPTSSVVYERLLDSAGALQMPAGGPYLTANDTAQIAGWICAGAPATSSVDGGTVTGGGDTMPPTFGGASSATAAPNAVTLSWSAASDNVTPSAQIVYLVYQATTAGGESYATPTYTTAPGATSFTVRNLAKSTTYYFVVRAEDAAGNVDTNTVEVNATTPSYSDTAAPVFGGATAATVSGQTVTVSWNAATDDYTPQGSIVYLVYQATTAGGESYATPTYTSAPGATSYAITSGLTPGKTYYFVVRAEDQAGNISMNTQEVSATPPSVSYKSQVGPVLTMTCASGNTCHSGVRPGGNLDMSTQALAYSNLMLDSTECTTTKRVDPGSPSTSYLKWKLDGTGPCFFGSKMPKIGTLATTDYQNIVGWIAEGAPNN